MLIQHPAHAPAISFRLFSFTLRPLSQQAKCWIRIAISLSRFWLSTEIGPYFNHSWSWSGIFRHGESQQTAPGRYIKTMRFGHAPAVTNPEPR